MGKGYDSLEVIWDKKQEMWSEEIKYLKMDSNVRVIGVKKNVYLQKT